MSTLDAFLFDSINMETRLDNKIGDEINRVSSLVTEYNYTVADLNAAVNSEETLLDYVRDTEDTFGLEHADLYKFEQDALNDYLRYLDSLWY